MRETYQITDVFTPTTPARLAFVERGAINDRLVNAFITPGMQIVVYGHSGSGKTTLLVNKLLQTYDDHITSRCVSGASFDSLLLDAFDQLEAFYEDRRGTEKELSSSFGLGLGKMKSGIEAVQKSSAGSARLVPPQLSPRTLGKLLGEANCCWVLEDFHKIDDAEKSRLAQAMKVFMDMSDEYRGLKIVAVGAVATAREVIRYDEEMRNRVAEIHVPLMLDSELLLIIGKGANLLNLHFSQRVKNDIVACSNGLAAVCHQLCLNACFSIGITETTSQLHKIGAADMKAAVELYVNDASDTFKSAFDRALRVKRSSKYENSRLVLGALVKTGQDGATHAELLAQVRTVEPDYPAGNMTYTLKDLRTADRGNVVIYDPDTGRHSFRDPFYRAYAMAFLGGWDSHDVSFSLTGGSGKASTDLFSDLLKKLQEIVDSGERGPDR